jgi:transposase
VGVPPAHGVRRQPVVDEPRAAEAFADAKKKSLTAVEQAEPRIQALRRSFIEIAKRLDPHQLVFIDEAGSHVAMTREYARAPRGERAYGTVPRNAGTVTTMIGALDVKGVRAMMTIEGATDAEVFETFLERFLLRKLKPGDIVVLDNVGAHRTAEVRRLIRSAGARVLYLPPYSPDLNPIELAWSKLKGLLRDFGARTRDALDDAIRRAMDLIDGHDAAAWFAHCGYAGQLK